MSHHRGSNVTYPDNRSRRHVILLAYYFPPMGLSGVQRMSKLAKYLPEYGWDVTVVTARPRGYFAHDDSLRKDMARSGITVIPTRSLDPTRLFRRTRVVDMPGEGRRRVLGGITQLLVLPDNKLGWLPFARRACLELHRRRAADVVLSSAPPYTAHLAGRSVSRALGIPLVIDFRDDWVGNPRHRYPTRLHRHLHERLEHAVVHAASVTITINPVIADSLRMRSLERGHTPEIRVITQGYDPADFPAEGEARTPNPSMMTFLYAGIFYDAQTPDPFLAGLQRALVERPAMRRSIRAEFVGLVPSGFNDSVVSRGLQDVVVHHGYLPHTDTVERMSQANVLWLTIGRQKGAEGISTGKLYEYFGARRPILGLVPDGVAREDLIRFDAAELADPDDEDDIARAIIRLHERWVASDLPSPDEEWIRRFDRRRIAGEFAAILDETVSSRVS